MTDGYATWESFRAQYGEIPDFDVLNVRISRMLDAFTGNRSKSAKGVKAERLNDCACALINMIADMEKSGAGHGLLSVSNDGYSEHYAATNSAEMTAILRRAAFQMLSGTGLMGAL